MGVCDSTNANEQQKRKNAVSSSSFGDYSTGANSKENEIKKITSDYILPQNLAKRDDINKYYNITQKILGEGASGIVCIGEKNGKQYDDFELNELEYQEAVIYDNRSCFRVYISLLKREHRIIFTFFIEFPPRVTLCLLLTVRISEVFEGVPLPSPEPTPFSIISLTFT